MVKNKEYIPGQRAFTARGNRVMAENLEIQSIGKEWIVIDRDSCTVLCLGSRLLFGFIYEPIRFSEAKAAQLWINGGSIGELQESLGLAVTFTNQLFLPPSWEQDSADPIYREKEYG